MVYILVSDHNAMCTDLVLQKVAIYGADFSAHFGNILHFPALFKQISFVIPKSRQILLPICIFKLTSKP
jgi:hypothetical protein